MMVSDNHEELAFDSISVMATDSIPGDYNHDGKVDAADYVVWRKGLGTAFTQDHYNTWRANFGTTLGSGSVASPNATIPEPTTLVTLIAAAVGIRQRRCQMA